MFVPYSPIPPHPSSLTRTNSNYSALQCLSYSPPNLCVSNHSSTATPQSPCIQRPVHLLPLSVPWTCRDGNPKIVSVQFELKLHVLVKRLLTYNETDDTKKRNGLGERMKLSKQFWQDRWTETKQMWIERRTGNVKNRQRNKQVNTGKRETDLPDERRVMGEKSASTGKQMKREDVQCKKKAQINNIN